MGLSESYGGSPGLTFRTALQRNPVVAIQSFHTAFKVILTWQPISFQYSRSAKHPELAFRSEKSLTFASEGVAGGWWASRIDF